jgi:hypothetical protein
MERFARFVVAGGIATVVGLWAVELSAVGSPAWAVGVAAAVVGAGSLLYGVAVEIEWS